MDSLFSKNPVKYSYLYHTNPEFKKAHEIINGYKIKH